MAHCNLCNKNTRCSCKGGWCPSCWSTNRQISLMNDLLKFWLPKEDLRKRLADVKQYEGKIDSFTLYEFMAWQIDEEKFNEALADFRDQKRKPYKARVNEVVDTTWRVNPEKMCRYEWNSPWDRCIYCNSIRKYMKDKECLKYKKNLESTEAENE